MATKWRKTRLQGVRYREHPTRKHGGSPDRYFVITYEVDGKTKTEAVGWTSQGIKPAGCYYSGLKGFPNRPRLLSLDDEGSS